MANVFISYRREDAAPYAGRLCDRLSGIFGQDRVFMDVTDIRPGQDFVKAIEDKIGSCNAVIAVIGPEWLAILRQRQTADEDFVVHEVGAALARDITVIPVLVGGAVMPAAHDLPASLAKLSRRQAVAIRDDRFDEDLAQLTEALRGVQGFGAGAIATDAAVSNRRQILGILIAVIAIAIVIAVFLARRSQPVDLNGSWIAVMQKPGQRQFRLRLNLVITGDTVIGTVEYPTGEGAINNGRLNKRTLTFETTHTPQFAEAPVTIRFVGQVEKEIIRLTAVYDSGMATGVARKAPRKKAP